ncbi:hypothetical protein PPTG_04409 [Phytophthora nicotianae INRA-310]|uniref:Transposase Tc1-like domain-containing protein n=2 Tax=Phytophthora nicotianae TaxID=4792 RepID=W2R2P6_PHYN3|nr:hypothetical protein PPTG_04409 [Phytophthora nicotianae INRA-310]ETN18974.1 hypothetical protein PPTG_04409 [Phytophthora nicotianae INRA-310]
MHTPGAKEISPQVRVAVALFLAVRSSNDKVQRGCIKAAAERFKISRRKVSAIWSNRDSFEALVAPRKPRACGRTQLSPAESADKIHEAPMSARQTLRCLASATGFPKTTLMRHLAAGVFRRATTRVKPKLTDVDMARRFAFALAHVERAFGGRDYRMHHMYDYVHVDEKWFNLYKVSTRYYLTKDEFAPHQACPNRRFIGKVMFLAAVARPRAKGTAEMKNVNMTRKVYVKMLKEKVFSAIRQLWPGRKSLCIKVQQGNAGTHVADILEAGIGHGWTKEMTCQSPRSLDMNVLDLGLFNAIQCVQYRYPTHNLQGLIAVVEDAFRSLPRTTIDKCFVTLQRVLQCVISCGGGNNYALPLVRKLFLNARSTATPSSLPIPKEIVIKGFRLLEAK